MCSVYGTEEVCGDGEACRWKSGACEPRYSLEAGEMEPGNRTDIQFWFSGTSTDVEKEGVVAAENVCLSLCNANGRQGRLARITTRAEFDRVLQLIDPGTEGTYFDGSDADVEGTWAWADGAPFWTEEDGCLQAYCGWNQGEPNNADDEHYMEIGGGLWNDVAGTAPRAFVCDFPCLTDFDCPAAENDAGCPYGCDGNGRCALRADRCCSYDTDVACVTNGEVLCKWDGAGGGVCVDRPCTKYESSGDCLDDTGCEWNEQCAQCAEERCRTTDSTLCTADKLCSWEGTAGCALSAAASGCVEFPSKSCCLQHAECRWDRENVCLKKPNTACEQAAAEVCGGLSAESPCKGDSRCAWGDDGCEPKYSYHDDGVVEDVDYKDIRFWHSNTIEANVADAEAICGSLCQDGKKGRLARLTKAQDLVRMRQLRPGLDPSWLDGSDANNEGNWRWSDGTLFWSVRHGCLQAACPWNTGEPNDAGGAGEHHIELAQLWNDGAGAGEREFFCEFPCTADAECDSGFVCKGGRCTHGSQCSANETCALYEAFDVCESATCFWTGSNLTGSCVPRFTLGSGKLEEGAHDDIRYWFSTSSVRATVVDAEEVCLSLCNEDGRQGRLARVTTRDEIDRLQLLRGTGGTAHLDGSDADVEGTWAWSDGTPFWSETSGCLIDYCPWANNEPNDVRGEHFLGLQDIGRLNDHGGTVVLFFFCEFPCAVDSDCPAAASEDACPHVCGAFGRCIRTTDRCCGFTKKSGCVSSDEPLCQWNATAQSCVDRPCQQHAAAGDCEADAECEWKAECTDPSDQVCAVKRCAASDEAACTAEELCRWSTAEGSCVPTDEADGCVQFPTQSCCEQSPSCTWDSTNVCLRVPNDTCTRAASEMCGAHSVEGDCSSDAVCKWEGGDRGCVPKYTPRVDGILEGNDYGVHQFWFSRNISANFADAKAICGSMCNHGRQGRLARTVTDMEVYRLHYLRTTTYSSWMDGTDEGHEGEWQWSDGTVFWTERHGCLQASCPWSVSQPDNYNDDEHNIEFSELWNDQTASDVRLFLCEFPCYEDVECGGDYLCKQGRCVHSSHCEATESTCSLYWSESMCTSGAVCAWTGTDCVAKYTVSSGVLEGGDDSEIRFWYSDTVTAPIVAAEEICLSLCDGNGRRGHLARLTTTDELDRARALRPSGDGRAAYLDGADAHKEGVWQWSDGTVFWTKPDLCVLGPCVWATGQPNGGAADADEHYLEMDGSGQYNDVRGLDDRAFFCDFPCATDFDCPNPGGAACPYKCTSLGRCELSDECCAWWKNETACSTTREPACRWNASTGDCGDIECEASPLIADGQLEARNYTDIRFWYSKRVSRNVTDAEAMCQSLCVDGRSGRLARITTVHDLVRLNALRPTGTSAWVDGSDATSEGLWRWSDGTLFWSARHGCLQAACPWNSGEPNNAGGGQGEHHVELDGLWNDVGPAAEKPFVCEFPCLVDTQCPEEWECQEGRCVHGSACNAAEMCSVYGTEEVCGDGEACRWKSGACEPRYSLEAGEMEPGNRTDIQFWFSGTSTDVEKEGVVAAENVCLSLCNANGRQGRLARITTRAEFDRVLQLIDPGTEGTYFDGSDADVEGTWAWADGAPFWTEEDGCLQAYCGWNQGEPNNADDEHYMEIGGGLWNDVAGTAPRAFVCDFPCLTDFDCPAAENDAGCPYGCDGNGRCALRADRCCSYDTDVACVTNGEVLCKWDGAGGGVCVDRPCTKYESSGDCLDDTGCEWNEQCAQCAEERCRTTDSTLCTADKLCSWEGTAGCALSAAASGCVEFPSKSCCLQHAECRWDRENVCLKKPNTACEQAAAEVCGGLSAESPCKGDSRCAWGDDGCEPKYSYHDDGVVEDVDYKDIRFWHSNTIEANVADAEAICGSLCQDGKKGRLARLTKAQDLVRMRQLRPGLDPSWLDGSDANNEGNWRWSDGTLFWSVRHGCLQAACPWNTGEPNDAGGAGEHHIELAQLWNDGAGAGEREFFCEFPCTADAECDSGFVCKGGRCTHGSQCSANETCALYEAFDVCESATCFWTGSNLTGSCVPRFTLGSGKLEEGAHDDIRYWFSTSSVRATVVDAEEVCLSLCNEDGRQGRLARVTTRDEIDRLQLLRGTGGTAHLDGSDADVEGTWAWSDGTPFWSETSGCLIDYCPWANNEPNDVRGEHFLGLQDIGRLNDHGGTVVLFFFCEFPCAVDSDCPAAASEDACPHVCGAFGRCIRTTDRCCGFTKKSGCVSSDEPLCQWNATAQSCVDRPCQQHAAAGDCEADAECEWKAECTDPSDQVCAVKRCAASDEAACTAEELCRWSTAEGSCVPTDEADGCVQFPTQSCCEQSPSCTWDSTNVCLRVPNDTCTRAASEMCGAHSVEGDCSSDAVCKWEGGDRGCVPKYTPRVDGILEGNDYGVHQFWFSRNISANFADAKAICGSMCNHGRQGRLARTVTDMEVYRLHYLRTTTYSSWMDGTDEGHEGEWQWSDGTVFWTERHGCLQASCPWSVSQPDNYNDDEHNIEFSELWNDQTASDVRLFLCEFPCYEDVECGGDYLCKQGRCVHSSHCEATESTCSLYWSESMCTSGAVCAWTGTDCVAKYTVSSGVLEGGDDSEIRFWYSDTVTAPIVAAEEICLSLCDGNGRRGHLARLTTTDELDRARALRPSGDGRAAYLDGADAHKEGVWQWSDGTVFWTKPDLCVLGPCVWATGQPNGGAADADEHYLEMDGSGQYNDVRGLDDRAFFCDFPCATDFDCPNPGGAACPYKCTSLGRCELSDECCAWWKNETACSTTREPACRWNASTGDCGDIECEASPLIADGQLEARNYTDIRFWYSKRVSRNVTDAEAMCQSLCVDGRSGRLARITTVHDLVRLNALRPTGTSAWVDGSDATSEGLWRWSDGTLFWSARHGCLQAACPWNSGEPNNAGGGQGEHHVELDGLWNDVGPAAEKPFVCEFPCLVDTQCPEEWECQEGRCVHGSACNAAEMCSVYGTEEVCGDGEACRWKSGACEPRYSLEAGEMEPGNRTDIQFWFSGTSTDVEKEGVVAAENVCLSLCNANGRQGRLARITTRAEFDRVLQLIDPGTEGTYFDGSDADVEGTWAWADGAPFWTEEDGCLQAYCGWNQGEPNNADDEHYMEIGGGLWNDVAGTAPRAFVCDFPCLTDFDCPAAENDAGCPYGCDGNGRCALRADRCCSYDTDVACVTNGEVLCKWDGAGGGVCVDRPCTKYESSGDCLDDTGCEWNEQCAQCAEERCRTTDSTLCTADKLCSWEGTAGCALSAAASGCVEFPSKSCCLQHAECRWDRENVCLKKPNTACEQAAAEVCGGLSAESPCKGDSRCAWGDDGCEPKYSYHDDGVVEDVDYKDIRFWHSNTIEANVADAEAICGSLCQDGKKGRLARLTKAQDLVRMRQLRPGLDPSWLDGSDANNEGNWRWSDGTLFWSVRHGCLQAACPWNTGEPNDAGGAGEHHIELAQLWNDGAGAGEREFFCEFPCTADAECDSGFVCKGGRCTHGSQCSANETCALYEAFDVCESATCFWTGSNLTGSCVPRFTLGSGKLEEGAHDDIRYWFSTSSVRATVVDAEEVCLSLCNEDGRQGRLARVTTRDEIDRLQLLRGTGGTAHLDGSDADVEGTWAWSDGTPFWSETSGCLIDYCPWANNEPNDVRGEHFLGLQDIGRLNDHGGTVVLFFFCEFPCAVDSDCPAAASEDACPHVCGAFGRCIRTTDRCCGFTKKSGCVSSDEPLCQWNATAQSCVDRPCQQHAAAGDCEADAECEWKAECTDPSDQVCAVKRCAASDEAACTAEELCRWSTAEGSCVPTDEADGCVQFPTQSCCEQSPSCTWDSTNVCLRVPNDTCTRAASEMCGAHSVEGDCSSDAVCKWEGGDRGCVPKYTPRVDGILEGNDYGVHQFWFSRNISANFADAKAICGSMCNHGRQGRLARTVTDMEVYRLHYLRTTTYSSWMDGTDEGHEGEWQWSDGTVFWTERHGCLQASCPWSVSQPDNYNDDEHNIEFSELWNDQTASDVRLFLCEFPCYEDVECGGDYLCKQGRCVHSSHCEATESTCSLYWSESMCTSGAVCAWTGTDCVAKYTVSSGVLEGGDDSEIRFWYSDTVTAPIVAAEEICLSLCDGNGRRGHLARLTTTDELDRARALRPSGDGRAAYLDGADAHKEGVWQWSDGTVFWTKPDLCVLGPCVWATGQPNGGAADADEHYLEMDGSGQYNDVRGLDDRAFFCDFPCATDFDCPNPGGAACPYKCTSLGRCELSDECCAWWKNETACSTTREPACRWNASTGDCGDIECEASPLIADGQLEARNYTDIRFWYSKRVSRNVTDAEAMCQSLCVDGRSGRLARITTVHDLVRLNALRPTGTSAWVDGSDATSEGLWRWSDGTLFWSARHGCLQAACPWNSGEPNNAGGGQGEHHVELDGLWNDVGPAAEKPFVCEFPCLVDTQCPEEWECQEGRCVHGSACNAAEMCSVYGTEEVCGDGEACRWKSGACEPRYSLEAGEMEPGNRTDIQFWFSGTSTDVEKEGVVAAENVCLSLCNANGRQGRLARITTRAEFDRVLQLIDPGTEGTYFDGSDADVEGTWAWADGAPFWTEEDGCLQAYCGWNQGEPNNADDEHYMEIGGGLWNDVAGTAPRAFVCDFPCLTDFDCPAAENDAGCPYGCDGNGRCALRADRCCSYDTDVACVTNGEVLCKWDGAGGGVCVDRPCTKYESSGDCLDDTGCEWNEQCAQCAEERCRTTDSTLCTADKLCSWEGTAGCALSAAASGCVEFPSKSCCLQHAECRWDRENVCLKKPNTACEQAAAEVCGGLSAESPCKGDSRCAWGDDGCEPKYSYHDDGVVEDVDYKDIRFWHSNTIEANVADAEAICGSLCQDGKKGRLARLTKAQDLVRMRQLRPGLDPSWLDGSDANNEGNWRWSDGTLFWSVRHGCLQAACPWNTGEPNDAGGAGEHHIELAQLWNDGAGAGEREFFCEFPCTADAECDSGFVCKGGRCTHGSQCSANETCALYEAFDVCESATCFWTGSNLTGSCVPRFTLGSGKLEEGAHDDIRYWFSTSSVRATVVDAEEVCLSLCNEDGRQGRLARVTTRDEIDRLQLLRGTGGTAHLDGSDADVEGTWAWSDGTPFWSETSGCLIDYCPWANNEPNDVRGEHFLGLQDIGRLNDHGGTVVLFFFCEFPCAVDSDCPAAASEDACPHVCGAFGRCIRTTDRCCGFTKKSGCVSSDEPLCQWNATAQSCVDRPCQQHAAAGDCEADAECEWKAECTDPSDQVCAVKRCAASDEAACTAEELCRWSTAEGSCVPTDEADGCVQFPTQSCCEQSPSCTWDSTNVCLRVPNDTCTRAASEMCGAHSVEGDCSSDAVCKWEGGDRGCVPKYTPRVDGILEGNDYGVHQFWFSRNISANFADAKAICGSMCNHGRQGRLARTVTDMEVYRLHYLRTTTYSSWMDGTDEGHEGEWQWSDGTVFWTERHGCLQASCPWSVSQPDNYNDDEHNIEFSELWNDQTASDVRLFLCEFPCYEDVECGGDYLCKQGRCVHSSHCEATESTCSLYWSESMCTSGAVCAWTGTDCVAKYTVSSGVLEGGDDSEIRFWYSDTVTAPIVAAEEICLSLCDGNGRRGHLARLTTTDELDRARALRPSGDGRAAYLDGADAHKEGVWQWSDGTVFWTKPDLCVLGPCVWATGQPNGGAADADEHYLEMDGSGQYNDVRGLDDRAFFCDFPCATDFDCPNPGGAACPYKCTSLGRCELSDECCAWWKNETACSTTREPACRWNASTGDCGDIECEASPLIADGQLEARNYTDIRFWYSKRVSRNVTDAEAMCQSLCVDGRSGRLARITTVHDLVRLNALRPTGTSAWVDGSDATSEGLWRWSDGTLFWSARHGCLQAACPWNSGEPNNAGGGQGEHHVELDGLWNDVGPAAEKPFVCEFPCLVDTQCPEEWECQEGRCVHGSACNAAEMCSVYGTEEVCGDGEACRWKSGACEPRYSLEAGEMEPGNRTDIQFWFSGTSTDVEKEGVVAAENVCLSLCNANGRQGRLARITTRAEFDRVLQLIDPGTEGTYFDGSDADVEGTWAWADGAPFWTEEDGCLQAYCGWNQGEPNNADDEHYMEIGGGLWNDVAGTAPRAFVCDFPCLTDFDCPAAENDAGCPYGCDGNGRCALRADRCCSYDTDVACVTNGEVLCKWDGAGGGVCVDRPCTKYESSGDCLDDTGCEWNEQCAQCAEERCRTTDSTLCTADKLCSWEGTAGCALSAAASGCVEFPSKSCCLQHAECRWDRENVCLKKPNTACEQAAAEVCGGLSAESPCKGDSRCAWGDDGCEPKYSYHDDGVVEDVDYKDIRFWHSNTIEANVADAEAICGSLCQDGKKGRLARLTKAQDLVRMRQLRPGLDPSWLDGSDANNEGNWRWSDGTLFWSVRHGCLQAACPWNTGEPNDDGGAGEHRIELTELWNDINGTVMRHFFCEFPCTVNTECETDFVCKHGRCTHKSQCSVNETCALYATKDVCESAVCVWTGTEEAGSCVPRFRFDSGKLEEGVHTDIRYWFSTESVKENVVDAQEVCLSLCDENGRQGRLARVTTRAEVDRIQILRGVGGAAHLDGSDADVEGTWAWSDGTPFWTEDSGCLIDYCAWNNNEPNDWDDDGEHYLGLYDNGRLNDHKGTDALFFFCEFPCADDWVVVKTMTDASF
ncbi:hypothetical protein DIPPA_08808 [Diplonema papillatum]|nr:hypothetical protein DIPPA_08808 [Diplonema papillatum]